MTQKQLNDIVLPEQAKENPRYENIEEALSNRKNLDKKTAISKTNKNLLENQKQELKRLHRNFNKNSRLAEIVKEDVDNTSFFFQQKLEEKMYHQKSLIGVKGRIQTNSYEVDGEKKYSMDVIAEKVSFLSSKKADE